MLVVQRRRLRINQETGSLSYEDSKGWHTEVLDDRIEQTSPNFNALIESAMNQEGCYGTRG
jgi:hypothetical protein